MKEYMVSVIVPVYNNEKYIPECIQSIEKQTYDINKIQIVLINDGSKDNSLKVCKELEKENNNIIVISQENSGVSVARNEGMKKAEGKYILFLDSDDMLEKHSIERLVDFFEKNNDKIDLVTYPMEIYTNEKARATSHYRYRFYTEGTGIYDLEESPYLGQSTINVMIKNERQNQTLFDKNMNYSEDEAFNTKVLMKKKKIGFCKEATYIYRKNVGSVTKNKSNPYYTFESLTKYNEDLIENYKDEKGRIPKYIQAIILNNLRWRIKTDEIFPYHYEENEFNNAISRIKNILSYIENGTILNMPNMPIYHKFYIFKLKELNMKPYYGDNSFAIMSGNEVIFSSETIEISFIRLKIKDSKKIYILGCVKSPICEFTKPKVFLKYKLDDNDIIIKEMKLEEAGLSHYQSTIKTNTFYKFECELNIEDIQKFEFYSTIGNTKMTSEYRFGGRVVFNDSLERYKFLTKNKKYILEYNQEINAFTVNKTTKEKIKQLNKENKLIYEKLDPHINMYRWLAKKVHKKNIWLYYDSANVYDNGYYQFLHDLEKKDGINRYYIYDKMNEKLKEKFTPKQRRHLLKYGSLKHRLYFLNSDKIISSDISLSVYCPFRKSIKWYRDIINYELIYLQHGILYANLLQMYGKEFNEIDKIVISSEFEKKNLVENYKYNEEDLICAGMPRFDIDNSNKFEKSEERKIIYAPSWRKYLVGELLKRNRKANLTEMEKSDFCISGFYKKNVEVLTSERLKKLLKQYNVKFEFKLHPNFNCYKKMFEEKCSENICMGNAEICPSNYRMLITDYSSFQFDFIKHQIPIVYFVPDLKEFNAGLHTYRKLDLPLEKAFGDVVYTSEELIDKIEYYLKNNFEVEEKYKKRMNNFFFRTENCREKIYNAIR